MIFFNRQVMHQKFYPLILWDSMGIGATFLLALFFRFDWHISYNATLFFRVMPLTILLYCTVNVFFGLYAHLWHYAKADEVFTIATSVVTSTVILFIVTMLYNLRSHLPLGVVLLNGVLAVVAFTAIRYRQRLLTGLTRRIHLVVGHPTQRVLIVGAGEAGHLFAKQLQAVPWRYRYELVGFVDDNPKKLNLRVHGARVLGNRHDIARLVAELNVSLIIIAIHELDGPSLRDILSDCLKTEAQIKIQPDFLGKMNSLNGTLPLKDVTPEDLLGRAMKVADQAACQAIIADKVVMVTGAAGSIGSELCRQICQLRPRQLLLLDNNESGLYDLAMSIKSNCADSPIKVVIADVTQQAKLETIFASYRPQVVFHAAAYKHVPLMEEHPDEAVRVNVLGTKNLVELAVRYATERFVFVSTDKAINPSSIMGATKRLGEMLIIDGIRRETIKLNGNGHNGNGHNGYANGHGHLKPVKPTTLFAAVRFGNVLGSRGSVVPTFTRQIDGGGPVTITHPDMNRYFMSIAEAVSLVIQAATLTKGGDIFMLDMGQELRITDLAHKMIRLRGLRPDVDIPIVYTGLRPGEKFHEELIAPTEERQLTAHPSIFRIQVQQWGDTKQLRNQVNELIELASRQRTAEVVALLWHLVKTNSHETPMISSEIINS